MDYPLLVRGAAHERALISSSTKAGDLATIAPWDDPATDFETEEAVSGSLDLNRWIDWIGHKILGF